MAYILKEHNETVSAPTPFPLSSYYFDQGDIVTGWCRYVSITFVAQSTYTFARMALRMGRRGPGGLGPLTAELYLADENDLPMGSILATASITEPSQTYPYAYWKEFNWNTPVQVTSGTKYAVFVYRYNDIAPASTYPNYSFVHYDLLYTLDPNFAIRRGSGYTDNGPPPVPPVNWYDNVSVTYFRNYALPPDTFSGSCSAVSSCQGVITRRIRITVLSDFPPGRPVGYNPDDFWIPGKWDGDIYTPPEWKDTPYEWGGGSTPLRYFATGGGRWGIQLVAVGHGLVYYEELD